MKILGMAFWFSVLTLGLVACATAPMPAGEAVAGMDRHPASQQALCTELAQESSADLNGAFFAGRFVFVAACNANPRGKNLFPEDNDPANVERRIKAYCEFSPPFRLCLVCHLLADKQATLKSVYPQCVPLMAAGDDARTFENQVLK